VSVLDRTNGQSYFVSVDQNGEADDDTPDGDSYEGAFSGDGSKLAFASIAGDIVPDDTNQTTDVFGRSLNDVLTGGLGGGASAQRVSNG
jgi:hypothetical protein